MNKDFIPPILATYDENGTLVPPPFNKDFFTDTTVYFVGSHNSMYNNVVENETVAKHFWILEPSQFSFINQDEHILFENGQTLEG